MCYMSPEGVVLGADSTSSSVITGGPGTAGFHYLNHNQKLFELGENSTVGIMTWGLAGFQNMSHRTLIAQLSETMIKNPPKDMKEIATRWASHFWGAYSGDPQIQKLLGVIQALGKKPPYDASNPNDPNRRTKDEEQQLTNLKTNLVVGFCIAGYWLPDRTPLAYEMIFAPGNQSPPVPREIPVGNYAFWGMPNMIKRLMWGADETLKGAILQSGKWNGSDAELQALFNQLQLGHPASAWSSYFAYPRCNRFRA